MALSCRVCHNADGNLSYTLREMQLGMRDTFSYFQCAECQCMQIVEVPENLEKYYGEGYYSLSPTFDSPLQKLFFAFVALFAPFIRIAIASRGWFGRSLREILGRLDLRLLILESVSRCNLSTSSRILDVGSGAGFISYCLRQTGFAYIKGIDPFIQKDLHYRNGLEIVKADLVNYAQKTEERFDVIMFNHSFEHLENPKEVLDAAAAILSEEGTILLRMPVIDCYAFEEYGEDLVSLDAPRHLIVHSRRSTEIVAAECELEVVEVFYDSNESQFWASEQYQNDIPLEAPESYRHNKKDSIFSKSQLCEFRKRARELNSQENGDWAAFYLKKKLRLNQK